MKECEECGCKYTPPDYKEAKLPHDFIQFNGSWEYSECPNCEKYFEEQDEMDAYEWVTDGPIWE